MKSNSKKILSTISLSLVLMLLLSMTIYASGGAVSFNFSRRVVDGSTNGVYYTLNPGSVTLEGSAYLEEHANQITSEYWAELRRPTWYGKKSYGNISLGY
jgi:hypothetical protein